MTEVQSTVRPKIHARVARGADLTARQIEQAYGVRAMSVMLKPHVRASDDRRHFEETVRKSSHCCVIEHAERVVGIMVSDLEHRNWEERGYWLAHFHYGFMDPGYRGAGHYSRALLRAWAAEFVRRPAAPRFLFGCAYLPSMLKLSATFGHVHLHRPELQATSNQRLLANLTETFYGDRVDAATGLAVQPTRPTEPARMPSSPWLVERMNRYLEINPDWLDGYAVPILVPITPMNMITGFVKNADARTTFKRLFAKRRG
ncbi:hypothetical protein FIV42_01155 [Persicimonas caeni]|uniref:Uncharacterized protein n=1 Tax=Persicimonas caeni TaxID=2292766 RepID=A0A4Y6PM86_PERCE|nr:hypothetical protein [Persicimonas caeni]QDG49391.1 hypothetical protein FIV42_01155 [Persicimonas caeni]QED30612.1 hypothetical protein FRD00_01150 [Persicimonas caeni]